GQVGRGALYGKAAEAIQPRPDVDAGQIKEWPAEQGKLRFWLGHCSEERPPLHYSRRLMAGIRNRHRPLRGRPADRGRANESGRRGSRKDHEARSRNVSSGEVSARVAADAPVRGSRSAMSTAAVAVLLTELLPTVTLDVV